LLLQLLLTAILLLLVLRCFSSVLQPLQQLRLCGLRTVAGKRCHKTVLWMQCTSLHDRPPLILKIEVCIRTPASKEEAAAATAVAAGCRTCFCCHLPLLLLL
jgi:hypothetical protein